MAGLGGRIRGELGLNRPAEPWQAVESTDSDPWQGRMDQFASFLMRSPNTYAHTAYRAVARRPALERRPPTEV